MRLRCQKDLLASLSERSTIVVEAAGIRWGGVAVVDATIECSIDNGNCFRHPPMGAQHTFASKRELRHIMTCLSQRTAWNGRFGNAFRFGWNRPWVCGGCGSKHDLSYLQAGASFRSERVDYAN